MHAKLNLQEANIAPVGRTTRSARLPEAGWLLCQTRLRASCSTIRGAQTSGFRRSPEVATRSARSAQVRRSTRSPASRWASEALAAHRNTPNSSTWTPFSARANTRCARCCRDCLSPRQKGAPLGLKRQAPKLTWTSWFRAQTELALNKVGRTGRKFG